MGTGGSSVGVSGVRVTRANNKGLPGISIHHLLAHHLLQSADYIANLADVNCKGLINL